MHIPRLARTIVLVALSVITACEDETQPEATTKAPPEPTGVVEEPEEPPAEPDLPPKTACFIEAYPDAVSDVAKRDGKYYLQFEDGTEFVWDDGREKTFVEKLEDADLEDTVSLPYAVGEPTEDPAKNEDPGRFRFDPFMKQLYGESEGAVRESLVSVKWPGGKELAFNERHGAADALRAVAAELDALPEEFHKYFTKTAGTFNWRVIKGTERMSSHSYAVALDINIDFSNYWRWDDKTGEKLTYTNRIPWEIVEVFERHGFIWGGKWHHYDTMHFEYRPELFEPACSTR